MWDTASNWPNLLTYLRIALVPLLAGALLWGGIWGHWLAVALFVLAGLTDFLDGWLARQWKQASSLGRMLDPIADKFLVCAVLLMLTHAGIVTGWLLAPALIILSREIFVSGLREHLGQFRVSVPVTRLAKWKTGIQMTSLGFLLAGPAGERVFSGALETGAGLLWAAAILTLYTGFDYVKAGAAHFAERRRR